MRAKLSDFVTKHLALSVFALLSFLFVVTSGVFFYHRVLHERSVRAQLAVVIRGSELEHEVTQLHLMIEEMLNGGRAVKPAVVSSGLSRIEGRFFENTAVFQLAPLAQLSNTQVISTLANLHREFNVFSRIADKRIRANGKQARYRQQFHQSYQSLEKSMKAFRVLLEKQLGVQLKTDILHQRFVYFLWSLFFFVVLLVILFLLRKIQRQKERLRLAGIVFEHSFESIMVTDANNKIIEVNPAFTEATEYLPSEVRGKCPSLLNSGKQPVECYAALWKSLKKTGAWRGEMINRRKSGEVYTEWLTVVAVKNKLGVIVNYVGIFSDITQRKKEEEEMRKKATHDMLTGLPNRWLLHDRISRVLLRAQRHQFQLALLCLDLDLFKEINDQHGHLAGDAVLQAVAKRLMSLVREMDTVSRIGGDEFVVLLSDVQHKEEVAGVSKKILASLKEPIEYMGTLLSISVSIGVAFYPTNALTTDALFEAADKAMYQVKRAGRSGVAFSDKKAEMPAP